MDIKSFFERKKREFSNKSEDGDNTKKAREQQGRIQGTSSYANAEVAIA